MGFSNDKTNALAEKTAKGISICKARHILQNNRLYYVIPIRKNGFIMFMYKENL